MPRASRYLREGYTYHLTHRCHDRRYLLKFAKDRDAYREWLRKAAKRYNVPVYSFTITSNHAHIIAHVDDVESVGLMMHLVAGAYAQQLNRRKDHEGSVWEHPSQWRWSGHDELTGMRSRYRIIAGERLLESLAIDRIEDFRKVYEEGIASLLERRDRLNREPEWTEALDVGDRAFVGRVAQEYRKQRRMFSYSKLENGMSSEGWSMREAASPYSSFSGAKTAANPLKGAF